MSIHTRVERIMKGILRETVKMSLLKYYNGLHIVPLYIMAQPLLEKAHSSTKATGQACK